MRFSDIIGQNSATVQLQRAYTNGRLSHAYIFDGPDGVGKRATAQALAALLLCEAPANADSCGRCLSCRQIAAAPIPICTRSRRMAAASRSNRSAICAAVSPARRATAATAS